MLEEEGLQDLIFFWGSVSSLFKKSEVRSDIDLHLCRELKASGRSQQAAETSVWLDILLRSLTFKRAPKILIITHLGLLDSTFDEGS